MDDPMRIRVIPRGASTDFTKSAYCVPATFSTTGRGRSTRLL
jgi:hypothetical protein